MEMIKSRHGINFFMSSENINLIREIKSKLKTVQLYLANIIENQDCTEDRFSLHHFFKLIEEMLVLCRESTDIIEEKENTIKKRYRSQS